MNKVGTTKKAKASGLGSEKESWKRGIDEQIQTLVQGRILCQHKP
jgi:hypothetical protein